MEILILILLSLTFIPVFIPFGRSSKDKSGQLILTATYLIYLLTFLFFLYCGIFRDLYFGYELGDLMIYFVFIVAMGLSNFGIGLRNKIGRKFMYFFSTMNIIASVSLIIMLFKSVRL